MTNYKVSYDKKTAHNHFVGVEAEFNALDKDTMVIKLPDWRPGRYELGNFAKNVRDFNVVNHKGESLTFSKRTKNEWIVLTHEAESIRVSYDYYANELNAGASYMDEHQLYINPVNCLVYEEYTERLPCRIKIDVPDEFRVAISLKEKSNGDYEAESYHELVDSPFIASPSLQHASYISAGIKFNIWFQGEIKPDWERLIEDFQKFTDYQIEKFQGFPVDEYHYIFQIDTKMAYHGVEHQKSTVLYLGPSYRVFESLYTELLGVCSHELYHTWNVKAIRPEEMFPYDYSQENYSRLGYVAEGVTTYMGDRILLESGVFDNTQYHKELANYIMRHLHNDGRKHYSVADSSFDTWLDGYVPGVPGRKTSIYVEGCLIAYICDMRIRKSTNHEKSLHDAMQMLYNLTRNVGYSDAIYLEVLEATAGVSFEDIFTNLIYGTDDYLPYIEEALDFDGRKLELRESDEVIYQYGFKGVNNNGAFKIAQVAEGSAASKSGLVEGDIIHGINGIVLMDNLSEWLRYFQNDEINLQIMRGTQLKKVNLNKEIDLSLPKVVLSLQD